MLKQIRGKLGDLSMTKVRRKLKYLAMQGRVKTVRPAYRTTVDNVYHCTVHKSGSQWIRNIMQDWRVYRYSGLRSYHYESEMEDGIDTRTLIDVYQKRRLGIRIGRGKRVAMASMVLRCPPDHSINMIPVDPRLAQRL